MYIYVLYIVETGSRSGVTSALSGFGNRLHMIIYVICFYIVETRSRSGVTSALSGFGNRLHHSSLCWQSKRYFLIAKLFTREISEGRNRILGQFQGQWERLFCGRILIPSHFEFYPIMKHLIYIYIDELEKCRINLFLVQETTIVVEAVS